MAKEKSATSGEYMVFVKESGSIEVFRVYGNTKGALREIADSKGFTYDPDWTTRQFGSKIIKEFGSDNRAVIGNYVVSKLASGSIEVYRTYDNTKGALREIAAATGFDFDPNWTTRQFGSKMVDFLNAQ